MEIPKVCKEHGVKRPIEYEDEGPDIGEYLGEWELDDKTKLSLSKGYVAFLTAKIKAAKIINDQ